VIRRVVVHHLRCADTRNTQKHCDRDAGPVLPGGTVEENRAGCGGRHVEDLRQLCAGSVEHPQVEIGESEIRVRPGDLAVRHQRDSVDHGVGRIERMRACRLFPGTAQIDDGLRGPLRHAGRRCVTVDRKCAAVEHPATGLQPVGER
jgi:hypothetical protein